MIRALDEDQGQWWLLKCRSKPFPWDLAHIYVCLTAARSRIELDERIVNAAGNGKPKWTPEQVDSSRKRCFPRARVSLSLLPGGWCDAGSRLIMPSSPERTVRAEAKRCFTWA